MMVVQKIQCAVKTFDEEKHRALEILIEVREQETLSIVKTPERNG
jgi:hypothetical protein